MISLVVTVLIVLVRELTLFAASLFMISGISDTLLDLVWTFRTVWRRLFIYRFHTKSDVRTLDLPDVPGRIVFFVPAWDEGVVLGPMLRHMAGALGDGRWLVYVGVYPNDPATIAAAKSLADPRIRIVVGERPGPTTKADCLNGLWRQMLVDEVLDAAPVKAVVLHDAEDVVHPAEYRVFDSLIERFDLVQIPVVPLIDADSRWVSGHYLDEFAVHHGKTLVAREAVGAGIPSAGVGCAFSRRMLARLVEGRDGPFDASSLTEDYELGIRLAQIGGRGAFVRLPETPGGPPVCVRAHFPATLGAAVTQKSRWIAGIALSGWDRLGWEGGLAERWMRINDRRALFAAVVVLAGYTALTLHVATILLELVWGAVPRPTASPLFTVLLGVSAALLIWRLLIRALIVARVHGWRDGLRSIPRAFVANIIDMMAARSAVGIYRRARRDGVVRWDKTGHRFPVDPAAAR